MVEYIYTRVSTDKQCSKLQLIELKKLYPEATVIQETKSGIKNRPILEALVKSLTRGDRLIIYSLDRLGRRAHLVLNLLEDLSRRGIILISKREGVDYTTIAGKLVTQIMISMAEMERELISERTKAGLQAARENGSSLGRPSYIPQTVLDEALRMVESEGLSIPKAANKAKISTSYLRKIIKNHRDKGLN